MKLISMTQKVLEFEKEYPCSDKEDYNETNAKVLKTIINNANLLSKKLQLGDFIPTDKDGNVLEKPKILKENGFKTYEKECEIYQQALDNVIFEGFEYKNHEIYLNDKIFRIGEFEDYTIEDLVKYNLTITPQAIKRFNL